MFFVGSSMSLTALGSTAEASRAGARAGPGALAPRGVWETATAVQASKMDDIAIRREAEMRGLQRFTRLLLIGAMMMKPPSHQSGPVKSGGRHLEGLRGNHRRARRPPLFPRWTIPAPSQFQCSKGTELKKAGGTPRTLAK